MNPKPTNRAAIVWILFLFSTGCQTAGIAGFRPPEAGPVNAERIEPYFTWNAPASPEASASAGNVVPLRSFANEATWQATDQDAMKACLNTDPKYSFVKAFYKSWEHTLEIKYCYREYNPERSGFRHYYVTAATLRLSGAPDEEESSHDVTPGNVTENRVSESSESEPKNAKNSLPSEELPPELADLRLLYAKEVPGRSYDSQRQISLERGRFLFLLFGSARLFFVDLLDMQTYLDEEAVKRMLATPDGANGIRENTLFWKRLTPAAIPQTCRESSTKRESSLEYRRRSVLESGRLKPRVACLDLEPLGLKTPIRLGWDGTPNLKERHLGTVLIRSGEMLFAWPLDVSGVPVAEKMRRFDVQPPEKE